VGYSFGASQSTHKINCGTAVTRFGLASSWAARFKINAANTTFRALTRFVDSGETNLNFGMRFNNSATNQISFQFLRDGGGTAAATWTTGFGAGSTHTLVATYDGANMRIYADTDSAAKATVAETGTPLTTGTLSFMLGNGHTSSTSLDGTLYEIAWWPTTVLTGAQAAQFGAGFTADMLRPLPSNHWMLMDNISGTTIDHIGNVVGTVTGASLVAHTPIYMPTSPRPFAAAVSTFTLGTGSRRTLSSLGTRIGSRQVQEA
jgi:hypothetical protein